MDAINTWKRVRLEHLCHQVIYTNPQQEGQGSFNYIDITSIDNQQKKIVQINKIANSKAPSRARQKVRTDDIVVSTIRPNLNAVAYIDDSFDGFICSTGLCVLRPIVELINPLYLFYWTQSREFVGRLSRVAKGASYPSVSNSEIKKIFIPLPTLPEQKAIVEILQQAERLKELRNKIDGKAKKLVQSIFNQMFSEPKEDWIKCKLRDVIDLEAGKSISARSNPASKDNWGVLKVSAVTKGIFLPEENKELIEFVEKQFDYEVQENDLLITRANTQELVGASAIVRDRNHKLILPDKIWRAIFNQKYSSNPFFMYGLLNTAEIRHEISRRATGTSSSMKNISQNNFLNIKIQLPPDDIQEKFKNITLKTWDDILVQQENVSKALEALNSDLQIQAFTGKLTQSFRQKKQYAISTHAEFRDEILRINSKTIGVIQQEKIFEIEKKVTHYLSEEQEAILTSLEEWEGYALAENDFRALGLPPNQVQRNLDLLAAIGLIKSVNVAVSPSGDRKVFYIKAYRTLQDDDDTRITDLATLENEVTI